MARTDRMTDGLPEAVAKGLRAMGHNIRSVRKEKRVTMDHLARRMFVSPPTVRKLERGDPTVSVGSLALALWALNISLPDVAPRWDGTMLPPEDGDHRWKPLPPYLAEDGV